MKDTIKVAKEGKIVKTLPREPASRKPGLIVRTHTSAKQERFLATDDVSLIERYAMNDVYVVQGGYRNIKVTIIEDIKEIN